MDYNTSRVRLVMPEYGRNIQQMVEYAMTIDDRDERTRCVGAIAGVMLNIFPQLREDANCVQKVWDHIAMISGYRLDVDSPYPLPTKQEATTPPANHLPYPANRIRLRAYGTNVQNMLRMAAKADTEEERMAIAAQTAQYMKRLVESGGKDSNAEDRVAEDITELTDGQLRYSFEELMEALPADAETPQQRGWARGGYQQNSRQAAPRQQRPHFSNNNRNGGKPGGAFRPGGNRNGGGKRHY